MARPLHQGNPYRAILRRDYPEPFIALLAFILGIWLWDHYFGVTTRYAPGTEEVALIKIDRDLRLADAMEEDPAWLRWVAGVGKPAQVRENALGVFEKLSVDKSISWRGLEAYAIIKAEHEGLPMKETLGQVLQGQMASDFEQTSQNLANHRGTWWHARMIESWEENLRPGTFWRESFGEDSIQLRTYAVVAGSLVWVPVLLGLVFMPMAIIRLQRGLVTKPKGYGGAWPLSLGLVVFLVATLAWIGFTMTLELGISALPSLHPSLMIFLDSAARMLPALIAMALLFRRPSHAIRVMGLNQSVSIPLVLGTFSLLALIDQCLRFAFGYGGANEPGGSLNAGDFGLWGLAFAVFSACIFAPLSEEMVYRGVLFRSARNKLGVFAAALLSSAVFAILHFYDGYGLMSVGIFGLVCALLYSSTGSLTAVIVLHMLYNASIKVPQWIVYHAPLG